ncbi:TadE-like protein [mine drainage metagenome]|uniref:TadE-like protein n=1 Tax=mine drainage metagenome TaxID=410659 RepID=A0A1J5R690_9ZZZZ
MSLDLVMRDRRVARSAADVMPPDRHDIARCRRRRHGDRLGLEVRDVVCRDGAAGPLGRCSFGVREARERGFRDRGSAVVDFALVGGLLTLLFAAVLQLTLALHVRNTLVDCAAEGARFAAMADRSPADGVDRARALIAMSLVPRFAENISSREVLLDGVRVIEIEVVAPVPVVGLIGPSGTMSVTGHALEEPA